MFILPKTSNEPFLTVGYRGRYPIYFWPVHLSGRELTKHKHVVGLSGNGKSKFLVRCAADLIMQGLPCSFIDPHGDSVNDLVGVLTARGYFKRPSAYERFLYVDFGRQDLFVPFNVLSQKGFDSKTSARNLVSALTRAYPELGITFRTLFYFSAFVLAENKMPFTMTISLLNDRQFRESLLTNVSDDLTLEFFHNEVDGWDARTLEDNVGSTKRRLYELFSMPQLRYSLGQSENSLDFNKILNEGISVAYNLAGVHNDIRALIGCFLCVGYEQATFAREGISPEKRIPHHIIIDEAPLFIDRSAKTMMSLLSEARKYKITEWLAHQYFDQLDDVFLGSLTNAQPIVYGVNYMDAEKAAHFLVHYDPYRVKHTITDEEMAGRSHPQWFSVQEQIEMMAHEIKSLQPRFAFIKRAIKYPFSPPTWQTVKYKTPDLGRLAPGREVEEICDYYARLILKPARVAQKDSSPIRKLPIIQRFGK